MPLSAVSSRRRKPLTAEIVQNLNETDAMMQYCKGVVKRYPLWTDGGVQKVRVLPESKIMRLNGKDFLLDKFIKQTDAQGKVNIISETGLIQMKSLMPGKVTLGMTMRDASLVVRHRVATENLSASPGLIT